MAVNNKKNIDLLTATIYGLYFSVSLALR